jgi:hypothetical protein
MGDPGIIAQALQIASRTFRLQNDAGISLRFATIFFALASFLPALRQKIFQICWKQS